MLIKTLAALIIASLAYLAGYITAYNNADQPQAVANQDPCPAPQTVITGKAKPTPQHQTTTAQTKPQARQEPRSSSQITLPRQINSLQDFEDYLAAATHDNFDVELMLAYVNGSSTAFERLVALYRNGDLPETQRLFVETLMAETSRPERVDFALELLASESANERRDAYNWLERAEASQHSDIYFRLVEASYFEENTEALSGLISVLSSPPEQSLGARDAAISRLNELAFHDDADIASYAISSVSSLVQNDGTLSMLKTHLEGSSEEKKLAALNGLYYFENPDDDLLAKIDQLSSDAQQSAEVRSTASDLASTLRELKNIQR